MLPLYELWQHEWVQLENLEVTKVARKEVHTVPSAGGSGWDNKVAGQVKSHHRTQEAAIAQGRKMAINLETEHYIHGRNGAVRDKNSYGNDPRNIPG